MKQAAALQPGVWRLARGRRVALQSPVVMGIVNLTPDSFSDGGRLDRLDEALAHAERLVEAGAGILDVGGESTRPGAESVPAAEELRRVLPFVREASQGFDVPLSIDTRKAAVAAEALAAGAAIVNDVSGLAFDPELASVVAGAEAGLVLMHMRGTPEDMVHRAEYEDVVGEVRTELGEAVTRAERAGIERDRIVLDPGIGFAKTARHSLTLLGRLDELTDLGLPLLVGPSRKSFIGRVARAPSDERVAGTVAACVLALERGARIFRVHDVAPVSQALAVAEALLGAADAGGEAR